MVEWMTSTPPNNRFVWVLYNGTYLKAKAIHGHDGVRPHWEDAAGNCYSHDAFDKWMPV